MQLKISKIAALDGMELKEATFRNQCFPKHFHDTYSIGIIEEGIEKIYLPEKNIIAHAHTVIIINPYDAHANSFFDKDIWKYRIIYINQDIMQYAQQKTGIFNGKIAWFPEQPIDDYHLYQLIMDCHLAANEHKPDRILAALQYLLIQYGLEDTSSTISADTSGITEAIYDIKANLSEKIDFENIALRYKMDKYKFIRAFKKQTGLTPVSYLLLHRINQAKTLIAENMPIVEVALETGFFDQSHFTHCFRKYIGISPLAYKKSCVTA